MKALLLGCTLLFGVETYAADVCEVTFDGARYSGTECTGGVITFGAASTRLAIINAMTEKKYELKSATRYIDRNGDLELSLIFVR